MRRILQQPKHWFLLTVALLVLAAWAGGFFDGKPVAAASTGPSFVEFDSGQVRPVAMSADGKSLFAVNTPNGTLEVFDLTSGLPVFAYRVPVGMEPVAVAARTSTEVWVTNLLSDSVSIVSLTGTPHVVRTLLVGDEPRDIVFAGNPARLHHDRASRTAAHRPFHRQRARRGRSAD